MIKTHLCHHALELPTIRPCQRVCEMGSLQRLLKHVGKVVVEALNYSKYLKFA